ncbi:helix-turn-helix domain-containing protein [Methylobacterium sp. EM32]|uniref:IclR family transcriptional regulator n=1 Tax=Methylobacterium sp. EM32 TaxID=3163481 RepID=UPI0033BDD056
MQGESFEEDSAGKAYKVKTRPKLEGVASAGRLLTVLTAFRRGDAALDLAELAERTRLVKSTIMRLCISLEEFGLIQRTDDGKYHLGMEVARLGSIYLEGYGLGQRVIPALEELVAATQETGFFYVRRGNQRLCVFRVTSPSRLRIDVRPGDLRPLDQSSTAQVLRLFDTPDSGADLDDAPIYTSGTTDPHIASMSMPVFDAEGRLLGAMTVSGPLSRFTPEKAAAARDTLRRLASSVSGPSGGSGAGPVA